MIFNNDNFKEGEAAAFAVVCVSVNSGVAYMSVANDDLTLGQLISDYKAARASTYRRIRHETRTRRRQIMTRMVEKHGHMRIGDIRPMTITEWHLDWSANGTKLPTGHSMIRTLRILIGFGILAHEHPECSRLANVLRELRFPSSAKKKKGVLVFEQARAICAMAHEFAHPSIALAQAFGFECGLRQKDNIGEVVPIDEPGVGLPWRDQKWMRGLLRSEIDGDLVLRHVTSKTQKKVIFNLKKRPLVMRELSYLAQVDPGFRHGPLVICETTGLPWAAGEFRRKWRQIADACGVPKNVHNMHSRAGYVTEGIESGVNPDLVRIGATHEKIEMTRVYNRSESEFERADADVQDARLALRASRAAAA